MRQAPRMGTAPDHKKKASRAKKAAAAATCNTAPSPRQQVEPELRLLRMPTMPASLSAFVQQFRRLLRMPTMPAWLSAFGQRFRRLRHILSIHVADTTTGSADEAAVQRLHVKQSLMNGDHRRARDRKQNARQRAWAQGEAGWVGSPCRKFAEVAAEMEAQNANPYKRKATYDAYLTIRPTRESGMDVCFVCFVEHSCTTQLDSLFDHFCCKHKGAGVSCDECQARFLTSEHLKWHTRNCHT